MRQIALPSIEPPAARALAARVAGGLQAAAPAATRAGRHAAAPKPVGVWVLFDQSRWSFMTLGGGVIDDPMCALHFASKEDAERAAASELPGFNPSSFYPMTRKQARRAYEAQSGGSA